MKSKPMSPRLLALVAIIAASNIFAPLYAQDAQPTPRFVPGEVIVKMKPTSDAQSMARSLFGVEERRRMTSGGEVIIRIEPARMRSLAAAQVEDETLALVEELNTRPDVEYAQPNWIYRPTVTPNDPRYSEQWHYFMNGSGPGESPGGIGLPKAWDVTKGSEEIVVAVLDTGILPSHEDIQGSSNLVPGFDMISDPFISQDGNARDSDPTDEGDAMRAFECGTWPSTDREDSWHGTHVAGTVGVGETNNGVGVAGVNWITKVQAVRVLGKCGGTTEDIIDAIRWAAGLEVPGVPQNETPAKVINMSLGEDGVNCPTRDQATNAAIRDVVTLKKATVVVAAGNSARDASQATPASCDNVISVAASDYNGNLVTWYSNFGQTVDVMAPGGDIFRDDNNDAKPDGVLSMIKPDYKFNNGTSMAAPHVAGVVALILAENPDMQPGQVEARIKHDALPRNNIQCPQPCGAGLLQAKFGPIITGEADLGVRVVVSPEMVKVDDSLTYSVTVTNHGPAEATGVTLTNTLPEKVSYISHEFNHGTCTGDAVITCDADPLPNGFHARLTVVAKAGMEGAITNHAEVKGELEDTNSSNDIAAAVTMVKPNEEPPTPEIPVAPPSTQGDLTEFRQMDLYQVVVEKQGEYKIETAGPTDVMMTLLGPNNKHTRVAQDLDSGDGPNAKIVETLEPGTYFVEIRHQSIFGMGMYEVSVQKTK